MDEVLPVGWSPVDRGTHNQTGCDAHHVGFARMLQLSEGRRITACAHGKLTILTVRRASACDSAVESKVKDLLRSVHVKVMRV